MSLSFLCELSTVITVVIVILTVDSYLYSRDDAAVAQKSETVYLEIKVTGQTLICGQDTSTFPVK